MKQFFTCSLALFIWGSLSAQNSLLVNFGNDICNNNTTTPEFSIINNPLSGSSTVINKCSMVPQLPDVYDVFIAYNPKDNKIYIADISDHINTKIWRLNVGLPKFIVCPSPITVAPTYSYNYVSNNFEFDNNGNLWSLSKYNAQTGSCNLDKFDVNTGRIINTRILQFPARYFPTSVE